MHGPPLTTAEVAATLAHQVACLRRVGVNLDGAVTVVADRHRIPAATVARLLTVHRGSEPRHAQPDQAAA